ncbi:MAG TPA: UrcA family protein [Steroidobacteraceae bacterium]|nr:UrcA family protein [Steroidobacteraceae bacterium]
MSKKMFVIAAGTVAAAVIGGDVLAQNVPMPEVTVESHRVVATTIGRTSSGIPIVDVSLGYTVSAQGLDIGTAIGARAFEARVSDAAKAACQELGKRYPSSTPSDTECARAATDKAMVKVHQLEDAATKK